MSKNRMVNTRYWSDGFIVNLKPIEKLLFIYFLTNQYTSLCGIYECPLRTIAYETGIDKNIVENTFERFVGKIHYIDGWVYVRNFAKHQSANDKMKIGACNELEKIPIKIKKEVLEIDKQYCEDDKEFAEKQKQLEGDIKKKKEEDKIINAQIDELVEYYKRKIWPKTKLTKPAKLKIRTRLLEKSTEKDITRFDELKLAIDNFSRNTWRMQNNKDKGLQFFFRSEDQIAKWLELEVKIKKIHKIL